MKFVRLVATLLYETKLLGSRSRFNSNFYCTNTIPKRRCQTPLEGSTTELFRRIAPFGHPNTSIVPILDQWMKEGRLVDKPSLKYIMKKLLHHKRFSHALEISRWMTDKRCFELNYRDAAFRLYLISKAKGIDEAERYFNRLPQKLKHLCVYTTLLSCYANAQCVDKAEALIRKIRHSGDPNVSWNYSFMLNLYRRTGNKEKFNALLQEMEEKGIDRTKDALEAQLNAYGEFKDIEKMDKIVRLLECNPKLVPDWKTFSAAANAYTKAGFFDKAVQMLKKAEALATRYESSKYDYIITQYGAIGRKDEVLRVWSIYKHKCKVYNQGYKCVLCTLVKLDDIEKAEEIFQEWETRGLFYDMRIPNILISWYCRKGLTGKAEALLGKAISKGGKPCDWTWYHMCEGYLVNEQCEKAVEMMKKVPTVESIKACLEYLKGVVDTDKTEGFAKLLWHRGVISLRDRLSMKMNDLNKFSMNR